MESTLGNIELRERALRQQLAAWQKLMLSERGTRVLSEQRIEEGDVLSPIWEKLRKLYLEDYPIARLHDTSDLIIHANGPHTHGEAPAT